MRRIVVIGRTALASPDFLLDDVPGTSGRADVLLRCLRAALLVSHGSRRDTIVYLVLLGGPRAPRTVRVDGAAVRFVRPDERALAGMLRSALARATDAPGFTAIRDGLSVAAGGLDVVLDDVGRAPSAYVLEEGATDVRDAEIETRDAVFFVGDHLGFDDETRRALAARRAEPVGVGPISVHADDAIAILANELDRRDARPR